jgi:DNA-binding transcriptional ArsR family regulator
LVEAHFENYHVTATSIASRVRLSDDTVRRYLARMDGLVERELIGGQTRYRANAQAAARTVAILNRLL